MTTNTVAPALSVEALQAMLKEAREAEKLVQQAIAARYGQLGAEVFETIVSESALTYSKSSNWVGTSVSGIPATDGFTASVTLTHTAETERRKPVFAQAKKDADAQKLTGDARKEFISAALVASEPKV